MPLDAVLLAFLGFGLGAVLTWLFLRSASAASSARLTIAEKELASARAALNEQRQAAEQLRAENASLQTRVEEERKSAGEKLALLAQAREELRDAFNSIAAQALNSNNQAFLQLAEQKFDGLRQQAAGDLEQRKLAVETLVAPLAEVLQRYDKSATAIEQERQRAYGELTATLRGVHEAQHALRQETANLVAALRRPGVRSRWGEMTLRRVAELAGMSDHCDFTEQTTVATDNGSIRPDMLVHLPGDVIVPVDAKAPLDAYLDAVSAGSDDDRKRCLQRYAAHVRGHMNTLAAKDYSGQFEITPAFTVLFLPGEPFFSAAAEQDSSLVEDAIQSKVLIATPVTLVALLKAISHGWRAGEIGGRCPRDKYPGKGTLRPPHEVRPALGRRGQIPGWRRRLLQQCGGIAGEPRHGLRPPLPRTRRIGNGRSSRTAPGGPRRPRRRRRLRPGPA